jgi:hypothetical protein
MSKIEHYKIISNTYCMCRWSELLWSEVAAGCVTAPNRRGSSVPIPTAHMWQPQDADEIEMLFMTTNTEHDRQRRKSVGRKFVCVRVLFLFKLKHKSPQLIPYLQHAHQLAHRYDYDVA